MEETQINNLNAKQNLMVGSLKKINNRKTKKK